MLGNKENYFNFGNVTTPGRSKEKFFSQRAELAAKGNTVSSNLGASQSWSNEKLSRVSTPQSHGVQFVSSNSQMTSSSTKPAKPNATNLKPKPSGSKENTPQSTNKSLANKGRTSGQNSSPHGKFTVASQHNNSQITNRTDSSVKLNLMKDKMNSLKDSLQNRAVHAAQQKTNQIAPGKEVNRSLNIIRLGTDVDINNNDSVVFSPAPTLDVASTVSTSRIASSSQINTINSITMQSSVDISLRPTGLTTIEEGQPNTSHDHMEESPLIVRRPQIRPISTTATESSVLEHEEPTEANISMYSAGHVKLLSDYAKTDGISMRSLCKASTRLELSDMKDVVSFEEFHSTKFKNAITKTILKPANYSKVLLLIDKAVSFAELMRSITEQMVNDATQSGIKLTKQSRRVKGTIIKMIQPRYSCDHSLILYLKWFERGNQSEIAREAELEKMCASNSRRISTMYRTLEDLIYGEEFCNAKRLALKEKRIETTIIRNNNNNNNNNDNNNNNNNNSNANSNNNGDNLTTSNEPSINTNSSSSVSAITDTGTVEHPTVVSSSSDTATNLILNVTNSGVNINPLHANDGSEDELDDIVSAERTRNQLYDVLLGDTSRNSIGLRGNNSNDNVRSSNKRDRNGDWSSDSEIELDNINTCIPSGIQYGPFGQSLLESFEDFRHSDPDVNVNLMLTTTPVTILAQIDHGYEGVHHITNLVGGNHRSSFELLFSILFVIKLTKIVDENGEEKCGGKFADLKSLTFLFPAEYSTGTNRDRFISKVFECLPHSVMRNQIVYQAWKHRIIQFYYKANDMREVVIFTKCSESVPMDLSDSRKAEILTAYNKANVFFRMVHLEGGTHSLPTEAVLPLISAMQIKANDRSWEIGCGRLQLAYALSNAASGGEVIAVDLDCVIDRLLQFLRKEFNRPRQTRSESNQHTYVSSFIRDDDIIVTKPKKNQGLLKRNNQDIVRHKNQQTRVSSSLLSGSDDEFASYVSTANRSKDIEFGSSDEESNMGYITNQKRRRITIFDDEAHDSDAKYEENEEDETDEKLSGNFIAGDDEIDSFQGHSGDDEMYRADSQDANEELDEQGYDEDNDALSDQSEEE